SLRADHRGADRPGRAIRESRCRLASERSLLERARGVLSECSLLLFFRASGAVACDVRSARRGTGASGARRARARGMASTGLLTPSKQAPPDSPGLSLMP